RYIEGDLAASEQAAEEALQIGKDAAPADALMVYGAAIVRIRAAQDRTEEIVPLMEQAAADYPRLPAWRAALSFTYADVGRTDEAADIVAEAARNGFEDIPYDQVRTTALVNLAEVAFEAGQREEAALLYEQLERWAEYLTWNGGNVLGQVRTYLGLLAAALGRDEL